MACSKNGDYGQNGQKWPFVRKNSGVSTLVLRTKWSKKTALSVNPHHNGQKFTDKSLEKSSPNLCVKYFSQAQVVQGMRMHPCLSTITLEGAVKGAPSAHLEEVPLTAPERVIHLTQLLVFVVPLPIF